MKLNPAARGFLARACPLIALLMRKWAGNECMSTGEGRYSYLTTLTRSASEDGVSEILAHASGW
jgi:hypothetical protein